MEPKLNTAWAVWGVDNSFVGTGKTPKNYAEEISKFDSVPGFWQSQQLVMQHIRKLPHNNMFSVMRAGESPKWEEQGLKGRPGRVAIRINLKDADSGFKTTHSCFEELVMAAVGEMIDDLEGVTVCNKRVSYVIYVWNTGSVSNKEFCEKITAFINPFIAPYARSVTIDYHPFYEI